MHILELVGIGCSPGVGNKKQSLYSYISYFIFIFDLFREGSPSTEVVFQGALQ